MMNFQYFALSIVTLLALSLFPSIAFGEHSEAAPGQQDRSDRVTQIERWIRDLDSAVYAVREPAFRRLGEALQNPLQVETTSQALRTRLQANPPPPLELRRRIEQLLERSSVDWSAISADIRTRAENDPIVARTQTDAMRILDAINENNQLQLSYAEFRKAVDIYGNVVARLKAAGVPKDDPAYQQAERDFQRSSDAIRARLRERATTFLREAGARVEGELNFEFNDSMSTRLLGLIRIGGNRYSLKMGRTTVELVPQNPRVRGDEASPQIIRVNGNTVFSAQQMVALGLDPQNAGEISLPPLTYSVAREANGNGPVRLQRSAQWASEITPYLRDQLLTAYPQHADAIRRLPTNLPSDNDADDTLFRRLPPP